MAKAAKPATSKKTSNRNQKSVAVDGKKPANKSRTKENPPNPAAGATPASSGRHPLGEITAEGNNVEDMAKKMLEMQGMQQLAALGKVEAERQALAKQVANSTADMEASGNDVEGSDDASPVSGKTKKSDRDSIPHPTGRYNIQDAMGLGGSVKRRAKYNSILRTVKELAGNARLNWELEWAEIPVQDKAQFFQVVRQSIPDMGRYVNDWATEAIVRQWMKNKRSYAVQKGFLDVKPKWEYLKNNSTKRTDAPRGNGKRKPTSQESSGSAAKKVRLAKASPKTSANLKGKGKADSRATAVSDDNSDEEDDEEEGLAGRGADASEEEED